MARDLSKCKKFFVNPDRSTESNVTMHKKEKANTITIKKTRPQKFKKAKRNSMARQFPSRMLTVLR